MQAIEQPHQLGIIPTKYVDDFIGIASSKIGGGHGSSSSTFKVNGKALKVIQLYLGAGGNRGPFHYCLFECTNHYHCYIDMAVEIKDFDRESIFRETFAEIQSGLNTFNWSTYISINGIFNRLLYLDTSLDISDNLKIDPAGFSILSQQVIKPIEPFDHQNYSPFGGSVPGSAMGTHKYIFELKVTGTDTGKTWDTTSVAISRKLSKLAAYISVHNNAILDLDTPLTDHSSHFGNIDNSTFDARRVKHLEGADLMIHNEGILQKWESYINSKTLTDSFEMFSEGIRIEDKHPSLAHVAYVSAIERIGIDIKTPNTCPGVSGDAEVHCEHCMKVSGAAGAYRAALKLTMSNKAARSFFSQTYGKRRSKTVHEAVLHGREQSGSANSSFSLIDDTSHFNFEVFRVRERAQEILLKALDENYKVVLAGA